MNRIFFTGVGIVSPLGIGREENSNSIFNNESGISGEVVFTNGGKAKVAAIIKNFDAEKFFNPNDIRRMERFSKIVLTASKFAIEGANISIGDGGKFGSIYSTYWGPLQVTEEYYKTLIEKGPFYAPPMLFPCLVTNASLGRVAKKYKLTNVSSFLVGACPLEYSYNFMVNKNVGGIVAGACDELYETNHASYEDSGVLKDSICNESCIRPFESNSKGMVLGEGAVVFVLETEEQAESRNAQALGELLAVRSMFSPMVIEPLSVEESIADMVRNIEKTIEKAGIKKSQVDCIISAANSDRDIDQVEARAYASVFGEALPSIPIVTPKELFGEIVGAGSMLSAYMALEVINNNKLPDITKRLNSKGNLMDRIYGNSSFNGKYVLCNSFVPGGNINTLVISRVDS